MANLTLNFEIDEASLMKLTEELKQGAVEALRPAKVEVAAPYASALEFGTLPASDEGVKRMRTMVGANGVPVQKEMTDTLWSIYQWAQSRAIILDPYSFARVVYKKIMEEGLAPHPYVRPALAELEENFTEIFTRRGSILGCAEELAEMIADNINGGAPHAPVSNTGALLDSISVSYSDESEPPEDYPSKDIWDIPDGDIHGNRRD